MEAVNMELEKAGWIGKLLFFIDGTDRLPQDKSQHFFVRDSHQVKEIQSNFIYCAPIHLLYEGNQVQPI